jgi:hypothetical protein
MKINQRSETFRKTVHLRTLLMPKMIVFVELPVSEKKKIVEEPFYDKRPEPLECHNPLWLLGEIIAFMDRGWGDRPVHPGR